MLTIRVNDEQLEAQLAERAQLTGKATQQLVEELLAKALEQTTPLSYPHLDWGQHSSLLQYDIEPSTDDAPAFLQVGDTTEFARTLRRAAWKL